MWLMRQRSRLLTSIFIRIIHIYSTFIFIRIFIYIQQVWLIEIEEEALDIHSYMCIRVYTCIQQVSLIETEEEDLGRNIHVYSYTCVHVYNMCGWLRQKKWLLTYIHTCVFVYECVRKVWLIETEEDALERECERAALSDDGEDPNAAYAEVLS